MAATNPDRIHLGLGTLEVGEYVNGVFSAYRYVGAIKATGDIAINRTIQTFMSGRPQRPIKKETTVEEVTFTFTLAELTVANIKAMIGGGLSTSNQVITFLDGTSIAPKGDGLSSSVVAVSNTNENLTMGGQCDVFNVALRFTHLKSCSTGKRQIWEVYIAAPTGTLTMPYNETDWQQTQVTWTALSDLTRTPGSEFFRMTDEV